MSALGRYEALVLASTSAARQALLRGLGLPFACEAPGVDESAATGLSPAQLAAVLAERKARAVAQRRPRALVIGSDQVVAAGGAALGKPADASAARAQLAALSGTRHALHTAVCVMGPGFFALEVDTVTVTAFPLSPAELDAYVATGEWQGCAGGYRIEGRGQALFSHVDGDRTSVQGLPMLRVVRLLREAGVSLL